MGVVMGTDLIGKLDQMDRLMAEVEGRITRLQQENEELQRELALAHLRIEELKRG